MTSENIVLLIKSSSFLSLKKMKKVNYIEEINKAFFNKKILLRIQSECLLGMYGDSHCDCETQRLDSIKKISSNDGIFIHLPQEAQGWGLHYKIKELELQVSGKLQDGNFIGIKTRDEAQKILLNSNTFIDHRSYEIVTKIFQLLNLINNNFILLSESDKKLCVLQNCGLKIEKYSEANANEVNENNLSEYLIKILNNTHKFDENTINKIFELLNERKYNGRALSTLIEIVNQIKHNNCNKLNKTLQKKILDTYNNIICGIEKNYVFLDENKIKIQNKFSCKVNFMIFKILSNMYEDNIFDRVSFEKMYYFSNKETDEKIIIRTSRVLEISDKGSLFFKGQLHAQEKNVTNDTRKVIENEITVSRLKSFFENPNYDYIKRVEMITFISENKIPGINIYIKRLPNIENRIMDIYGKKSSIHNFLDNIITKHDDIIYNLISDKKYEDENFTDFNLRFADIENAIKEEVEVFNLLKGVEE